MASNLVDHPYAATINLNKSSDELHPDIVTNFKDSPRKVLVQENKGSSLDILNEIAQNQDFSCLNSKNGLTENGFQIETNSLSSDEMEIDTNDTDSKNDTQDLEKNSEKKDLCELKSDLAEGDEKIDSEKPKISDVKTLVDSDIVKEVTDESDTKTLGEKNTEKEKEGNLNENVKKDEPDDGIDKQKENNLKDLPVANEDDKETDEMDVSIDEVNELGEDTDDADEGELNESLENSTDLTSEIKTGVGNGIVVSVMKRRKGRRKKRKKSAWSKPSPYKIRRVNSGSPKRITIEEPVENKEEKSAGDVAVVKESDVNESSAQTEESIDSKDEDTQPEQQDEKRLRSRRSRTPGKREGYLVGDELENLDSPGDKAPERKKPLLFHHGRKASPGQIKPLTAEELDRYMEPFKQGWKRELVYRAADSATKTQADTYYFPPTKGPKLRSMVQITDWLARNETTLTTDNFTFMRRAIGANGELVRNAASHGRSKASVDALRKKVKVKSFNDSHIHDDDDGQFDKPEIVIERDSDDFLAPIMSAVEKESVESSINVDSKKGLKTNLPNLEEFKEEKVEKIHPSNEEVIISPSSKKERYKATARKSTTQKTFKKSLPFSGAENLCSLTCPGMEGIPPMLHCNVCMCLFHNECVNYFDQDSDFVCLRCIQPPNVGESRVMKIKADNIMKVTNPTLINQLQMKPKTPIQSSVQIFPNSDPICNLLSGSQGVTGKGTSHKTTTPPSSVLPLYKMLPVITGSPDLAGGSSSSQFHYPVLLTKNTSAFKASCSTSSSEASPVMRSVLESSPPIVSRKSPAAADVANSKPTTTFQEIRPLIKQEPIDDSYQDAIKDNKTTIKRENNTKASTEALDNLKHVLSTRLSSPQSAEKSSTSQKNKPNITNTNFHNQQSFVSGPTPVRLVNNFINNISTSSPISISQNTNQPRKAFSLTSPPVGQFPQNQEYRIVPIGPPVPLNQLPLRMPLLHGQNFMPMPIRQPVTISPKTGPDKPLALNIVTTQEDTTAQGNSGPVVVNAKSITPMNGQLLTLPPPVVKKLTLNKPLALKINNRQITVPPSGFFPSSEGLKVFLPPNTFPTADDIVNDVTVTNEKSNEEEATSGSKPEESSVKEKKSSESQSRAKVDHKQKDQLNKTDEQVKSVSEVTCAKITDIKRNKYYGKCCLIQRLYGGYDCMFHIFKYLELKELVRLSAVCKAWRRLLLLPDLWRDVQFRDTRVSDWGKALKYVSRRDVQSISLKSLSHFEEPNRTWHQLVSSLHEQFEELASLKKISFGLVPAAVLQSIVGRLTHLHSFIAESISDFTDDSMWTVPTKVDVGNFSRSTQLKELKLRGTGGLSLPSFSFGCGLADIGKLTTLHTLHLTSLRNLKGSDFNFISNLTNLKELALGDCENWTQETYSHLQKLTSLERLRLESGGKIPDTGLGLALSHLLELERLELIKYTVAYTFGNHIRGLSKLRHLCIFPVNMNFMGEVNTNVHHAVENLKDLETLEWIIPQSSSSSIILDDNSNSNIEDTLEDNQQWIPFQTSVATDLDASTKSSVVQYTSVKQLKSKLEFKLPNTKISISCAKSERKLI